MNHEQMHAMVGDRLLQVTLDKYHELSAIICNCTPGQAARIRHQDIIKIARKFFTQEKRNEQ
jgi:translation initiation factor IF-1